MELNRPICFFDLESTGVDVAKDRIVEISILKLHPDHTEEIRTRLVNPGIPIPKEASEVHNIWDVDVADQPEFKAIAKGILSFIEGCDIAGFNNNNFDNVLLFNEFERAGVIWDYKQHHFIDVGNIFKRKEERTLSAAVAFYLGIEMENAHSAEADIKATKDVFMAQLKKYEDLPKSVEELDLFCTFDKPRIDIAGKFTKDEQGYKFNFGKHKGELIKDNISYVLWMLKSDFSSDIKNFLKKFTNS